MCGAGVEKSVIKSHRAIIPRMALRGNFLEVPAIEKRKRIPLRVIRALVKHIADKFNPEKIILFGSYAYGKPSKWSDVDLLVVMETPKGELETAMEISKSLPPHWFSIDIIARSQSVVEERIALGDWFLEEITQQGKVMYEQTDRRVDQQSRIRRLCGRRPLSRHVNYL
jgi:predicted nucleotidyltransferase